MLKGGSRLFSQNLTKFHADRCPGLKCRGVSLFEGTGRRKVWQSCHPFQTDRWRTWFLEGATRMHRVTMMADTSSTAPESNPGASECYREGGTVRHAAATRCSNLRHSRSEKNLFRDRISHPSARRYSGDVDQVVQRKWTNHDVGIGRRDCVGIDVIGNLSSLINKIAVHG